jgi:hypothetical protein
MKTHELTGQALDWAVAKCEGRTWADAANFVAYHEDDGEMNYSTDWAQGGPIIERERIAVWATTDGWKAQRSDTSNLTTAPTPLIAAMRCYVASKLGHEVDIPTELTQGESK